MQTIVEETKDIISFFSVIFSGVFLIKRRAPAKFIGSIQKNPMFFKIGLIFIGIKSHLHSHDHIIKYNNKRLFFGG